MILLATMLAFTKPEVVTSGTSTSPLIIESPKNASTTPFFSQFNDIADKWWGKRACGIASLAMVIDAHNPGVLASPDPLLRAGISLHGYTPGGWLHSTLVSLGGMYGLRGNAVDLSQETKKEAIASLKLALETGPALASVHYKLEPHNPIPHLIVVHAVGTSTVTISDPANEHGDEVVPLLKFERAWKNRYISFEKSDNTELASR